MGLRPYWRHELANYIYRINKGLKPVCEMTGYDEKSIEEMKKYADKNDVKYHHGRTLWFYKDDDVLPTIELLDNMKPDDLPEFFSSEEEHHVFMGRLFGHSESAIKRFLRYPNPVTRNPHRQGTHRDRRSARDCSGSTPGRSS